MFTFLAILIFIIMIWLIYKVLSIIVFPIFVPVLVIFLILIVAAILIKLVYGYLIEKKVNEIKDLSNKNRKGRDDDEVIVLDEDDYEVKD